MSLELESLTRAAGSLRAILAQADDATYMAALGEVGRNAYRSGIIQHFEFTYELCWKFMKRWIEMNIGPTVVDGVPRRELFRWAAESHLIDDVDKWMRYHAARNQTVHTYEPKTAEGVLAVTADFARDAVELLQRLKSRND